MQLSKSISRSLSRSIARGISGGDGVETVSIPAAYIHPMLPDLKIEITGGQAKVANYSIDDFRNKNVTVIKYVNDLTGNDSYDGNSELSSYKTLNKALQVSCDRIVLVNPSSYWTLTGASITTNKEIISPNGKSLIGNGVTGASRTWINDGGGIYHTANWLATTMSVIDKYIIDENGVPFKLSEKASLLEVQSNNNSYWHDTINKLLYVRCVNDRLPDIDIFVLINNFSTGAPIGAFSVYFENIILPGGFLANNQKEHNVVIVMYNCIIHDGHKIYNNLMSISGNTKAWLENCVFSNTGYDCISWKESNSYNPCGLEIGVISYNAGIDSLTDINNASTGHDESVILRLNGKYYNSKGPVVHDVNTCKSLNVNVVSGESNSILAANKSSFAVATATGETAQMWLYKCTGGTVTTFGAENRATGTAHLYMKKSSIQNVEPGTTPEEW